MKKCLLVCFVTCVACSSFDTPELPDVERKSFSYDDVMQKHINLKKRINETRKSNSIN